MTLMLRILTFLCLSVPAWATFISAEEAYNNQQYPQAFSEFKRIADTENNPRAQYYVASMYLNGFGTPKNEAEGLKYLQRSVDQEYDLAQALLGYLYSEGEAVEQDKVKAIELYEKAAAQGNSSANLNLGAAYYTGDGVVRDVEKARAYFEKVNLTDTPVVGRYLGDIYLNDANMTDYKKALRYYSIAAEAGDLAAFKELGQMYQKGLGVEKDDTLAQQFLLYAASEQHAPAQYILGLMYANGEGVKRDWITAYAWLSLASNQKLRVAQEALTHLTPSLSLSDIDAARRKALEIQQNVFGKTLKPTIESQVEEAPAQNQRVVRQRLPRRRRR